MRNPKNLSFWADVTQFIVRVYQVAGSLPKEEMYGLASQMKRAAVSIRLNIVEGAACESPLEFCRFLEIPCRSVREAMACVELAAELHLCNPALVETLVAFGDRVSCAIYAYRSAVKRREPPPE